jgi:sugar phosphate isomerase/epimerase
VTAPVSANPAARYLATLGLQVWTVRDQLEQDLPGTLRAIRAAGYAQVELMRTSDARVMVAAARDLGLGVTSAFIDWAALVSPGPDSAATLAETIATARDLGLRHLVFGYIAKGHRETVAQLQAHAARANAFGRDCRAAGLQLSYHHHAFEFAPLAGGSTTGWDVLVRELDPALVRFEVDVFWAALAGRDPLRLLHDLRGRVAQVHLKDLPAGSPVTYDETAVPPATFREIGRGHLDFRAILAACAATGAEQCHVEQDQSPDPRASLAESHRFLRARAG